MEQSENVIVIPIGNREAGEYLAELHEAIAELKLLAFERRSLDLEEPQCYALYMLTELQKRIVQKAKQE